jgi:hypothetical protein
MVGVGEGVVRLRFVRFTGQDFDGMTGPIIQDARAFAVQVGATVDLGCGFSCSRVQEVELRSTDSRGGCPYMVRS